MHERELTRERDDFYHVLSEIKRPFSEEWELFDNGDALAVDDQVTLAYRKPRFEKVDRILVGRELTVPVVVERRGNEIAFPYKDEESLRGSFGVIFTYPTTETPVFYVGEKYKFTFLGFSIHRNQDLVSFLFESKCPLQTNLIDGQIRFANYLENISRSSKYATGETAI